MPDCAVCVAKSSRSGLGMEDRKLIYAGEYRPFCKSCVMRSRLLAVGSRRYSTGTSGIAWRCWLMFLTQGCQRHAACLSVRDPMLLLGLTYATYRCIVIPHPRKSFTRNTLLITSLPRLSNTKTFHIGSPSSFKMGVDCGRSPPDACSSSLSSTVWLRLRMRLMEAELVSVGL